MYLVLLYVEVFYLKASTSFLIFGDSWKQLGNSNSSLGTETMSVGEEMKKDVMKAVEEMVC